MKRARVRLMQVAAYAAALGILVVLGVASWHSKLRIGETVGHAQRFESATAWTLVQARLELSRFQSALARHVAGDERVSRDDVDLRFEILWSRIPILDTELPPDPVADRHALAAAKQQALTALATVEQALADQASLRGNSAVLTQVTETLEPIGATINTLLLAVESKRRRAYDDTMTHIAGLGERSDLIHIGFVAFTALLLLFALGETALAKRAEARAVASTERFRHFAESASDWLWELDENLSIRYLSERWYASFGLDRDAVVGRSWLAVLRADDSTDWRTCIRELRARRAFKDLVCVMETAAGDQRVLCISGQPHFGTSGRFMGYRGVATDITRQSEQERQIRYLARHDPLTDLMNRSSFQDIVERELSQARKGGYQVGLMLFDLDGFKDINDTFGHDAGDLVLREVASRLQIGARDAKAVARLGGDEFALVVATGILGRDSLARAASRLIAAVEHPIAADDDVELRVGVSVGVASFPADCEDARGLLKAADIALYSAKRKGRGHVQTFSAEMGEELKRRKTMERALRQSIDDARIELAFQPQVRVTDGRLQGVEALARWHHPELGHVPPDQFIPVAEESGLIVPLGRLILDRACREAASWTGPLAHLPISVNLSPAQFMQDNFVAEVRQALRRSQLPPHRLVLEVTESLLVEETDRTREALTALKLMGVRIALDDFGVGYSSLSFLRQFPIQRLKFDRAFLCNIKHNEQDRRILQTMVMLGQALGLETVAEGVETADQLSFLRSLGCDQAQGFLFSPPVTMEKLRELADRPPWSAAAPDAEASLERQREVA